MQNKTEKFMILETTFYIKQYLLIFRHEKIEKLLIQRNLVHARNKTLFQVGTL